MKKRFLKIWLPYLIAQWLYILMWLFLKKEALTDDVLRGCLYLSGILPFNTTLWYIVEIMAFYILFYLKNKLLPRVNNMVFWIASLVIYVFFCRQTGQYIYWYRASSCLVLGILYGCRPYSCGERCKNRLVALGGLLFMVTYGCYVGLYFYGSSFQYSTSVRTVCGFMMPLLFLFFVEMAEQFVGKHSKISLLLGSISFEIYLYHNISLLLVDSLGTISGIIRIAVIILMTIAFAIVMKHLYQSLIRVSISISKGFT